MASARQSFLSGLAHAATSRLDRAVLIAAFAKRCEEKASLTLKQIQEYFEQAHLAVPSVTVLAKMLTRDRRISLRKGVVRALQPADAYFDETFPSLRDSEEQPGRLSENQRLRLRATPLIDDAYLGDLERMLALYATVHVLENSMRRLIEQVLSAKFGADWWHRASNVSQKQKHDDRLDKEGRRKWLPARSTLGPLYSLDWSDLVSLMRKYEADFLPFIGEVDFLHRYADLGLLRHVIAHNGFIDDEHDFERFGLALRDWQVQVGRSL